MTLRAEMMAAPTPLPSPAAQTSAEKPEAKCVCDHPHFQALTDKARAVQAYWEARREVKTSAVISGTGALFSLLLMNTEGIRESTESYERSRSKMFAARAKAEGLGALKVTGDDRDGQIEFKIEKGVDYVLTP